MSYPFVELWSIVNVWNAWWVQTLPLFVRQRRTIAIVRRTTKRRPSVVGAALTPGIEESKPAEIMMVGSYVAKRNGAIALDSMAVLTPATTVTYLNSLIACRMPFVIATMGVRPSVIEAKAGRAVCAHCRRGRKRRRHRHC
ncbi:MAG: hypothetical protein HOI95_14840 [Chromatiales bacterium]|nr:hypothetical protein [Chromatiales bacterium]